MTARLLLCISSLFLFTTAMAQTSPLPVNLSKYDYVDPQHMVPTAPLIKALEYYDTNYNTVNNKNYISVVDFTQNSNNKRLYVIDMKSGAVVRYLVAHGKGSDPAHTGYAKKFSNVSGSDMSSIGMYLTAEEYSGEHGHSLRIRGLDSTNSNAYARAIVIHGAAYVDPSYTPLGRSDGCPAVEQKYVSGLVDQLKDGSVYYIWAGQN